MAYRYDFDETSAGDLSWVRADYELLQVSLRELKNELTDWNRRAREHGATDDPYAREVSDIDRMLDWADARLVHSDASEITVRGISVGSLGYHKAALLLNIRRREAQRDQRRADGWPDGVLQSLDTEIERAKRLAERIAQPPSEILWEVMSHGADANSAGNESMEWDAFISHASEDKEDFVRPLADALQRSGLKIWYDEFTLSLGDSLRRSIDRGLAHSRFGVVVVSRHFLQKEWPQRELDGLVAREIEGVKVILPVWHQITRDEIVRYSPTLADRLATTSSSGVPQVVRELLGAMGRIDPPQNIPQGGRDIPTDAKISQWHTESHARYLQLLAESGQEWPVSIEENHYQFSFELIAGQPNVVTSNDLRGVLKRAESNTIKEVWTGWSMFQQFERTGIAPYVLPEAYAGDEIEVLEACILGQTYSSTTVPDFWRVSTPGTATIIRPYREDRISVDVGSARLEPGTYLAPRILARELFEFVSFAREIARGIGHVLRANIHCTWWGLKDRVIRDAIPGVDWHYRVSHADTRNSATVASMEDLERRPNHVVASLANPMLRLFDGLEITPEWIEQEKPGFRSL